MVEKINEIVVGIIADITGLDANELEEHDEMNLYTNGILDSLSIVNLISEIEKQTCISINFNNHSLEDFVCIKSIVGMFKEY